MSKENAIEKLDDLEKLLDERISEYHNIGINSAEKHALMLYRGYVWDCRNEIRKGK